MGLCASDRKDLATSCTLKLRSTLSEDITIDDQPVGQGRHGSVYKARTPEGAEVALKVFFSKQKNVEEL